MPREFKLPDVGEGISEAQLLEWHVEAGEEVAEGQTVAEISTDKIDVELPAPVSGKVLERRGEPGEIVAVGAVLLVIAPGGEEPAAEPSGPEAAAPATQATPARAGSAEDDRGRGHVVASPLARRVAVEHGVEVEELVGTGPGGRIRREDVERAIAAPAPTEGVRREPLDRVRAVMAQRMGDAARTTAASTTTFVLDATRLRELLDRLRPDTAEVGVKLTPLAVIASCAVAALRRHERFNATVDEPSGELLLHRGVDLGIAAATERGLVVPVIHGADGITLLALARRLRDLAERAREGGLEPGEVRGGTFTVSSTGALERASILSTQPVINLPQTATMWCSRIESRPWVIDGEVVARPLLTCSLTFDHRYIDGAEATAFINEFVGLVERPELALAGASETLDTEQLVG